MTIFTKSFIEGNISTLQKDPQEFLRTLHMKVICPSSACNEVIEAVEEAGIPIKIHRDKYMMRVVKKLILNSFSNYIEIQDIIKACGNRCGMSPPNLISLIINNSDELIDVPAVLHVDEDKIWVVVSHEDDPEEHF